GLLTSHLTLLSIPPTSLPTLLSTALSSPLTPSARRSVEELLTLEDYTVFHARMVRRNVELDGEVMAAVMKDDAVKKNKIKEREVQRGGKGGGGGSEDADLRLALQLSLMVAESEAMEREREQAEIDYAIKLSLAL